AQVAFGPAQPLGSVQKQNINKTTFAAMDFWHPPLDKPPPALRASSHIIFNKVSAMTDGVAATPIPAALNAAILAAAVPLPPLTIAPAWPMRRPGGAVVPAINPATGFRQFFAIHSAASSSALPPISPIRMMPRVSGSSLNILMTSRWEVPLTGSPPMPTQVLWPTPRQVSCQTAS